MSKFLCVCGETIRISGAIPNPIESLLVPASILLNLPETNLLDAFYEPAIHAFVCPISGHAWIFWDGLLGPLTAYRLEGGDLESVEERDWAYWVQETLGPVRHQCHRSFGPLIHPDDDDRLEQWRTIRDVTFDGLAEEVRPTELDEWLLPVRRCAEGDHLWVWWDGAQQPPATFIAVGITTEEKESEAPFTTERLSVAQRVLRWLAART